MIRLGGVSFRWEHLKVEFESSETSADEQFIVQLRCAVVSATRYSCGYSLLKPNLLRQ